MASNGLITRLNSSNHVIARAGSELSLQSRLVGVGCSERGTILHAVRCAASSLTDVDLLIDMRDAIPSYFHFHFPAKPVTHNTNPGGGAIIHSSFIHHTTRRRSYDLDGSYDTPPSYCLCMYGTALWNTYTVSCMKKN